MLPLFASCYISMLPLQIRGKKALVLEPEFVQPLGLIADALTLKEHGVEMHVFIFYLL